MQVTIDVKEIHDLLRLAKGNEISVIATAKGVEMISFDSKSVLITKLIPMNIAEEGETHIERNVLELLPKNGEVIITEKSLSCGRRKIDYQETIIKPRIFWNISSEEILKLDKDKVDKLMEVEYAVAKDLTRPILTGVYLGILYDSLSSVAMDGFRLAKRSTHITALDATRVDWSAVVPLEVVKAYKKVKGDFKTVSILSNDNSISFTMQNDNQLLSISSRLLEGKYINYKSLIPEEFKSIAHINSQELLGVIKSNKEILVKLDVNGEGLFVTSWNSGLRVTDEIHIELEGEELEIAFNPKYLEDALKFYTDKTALKFNSSISPLVISNVLDNLDLILPVRLGI